MNFVQSIKDGFARCFDFSGRSSRRQFWFFYLFHELSTSIAFIADNVFGLSLYKIPIAEVKDKPVGTMVWFIDTTLAPIDVAALEPVVVKDTSLGYSLQLPMRTGLKHSKI